MELSATLRPLEQEWLVALIEDVRRPSSDPCYRVLGAALRSAIACGEVPVGTRLPAQRDLALLLSVGRTPVVAAYNLLSAESLIVMRRGAGTWVARRP